MVENVNLHFTIQQVPFTGVGFGKQFFVLVPMADISFFAWWQYLPHNAILWVWLKMGVFGFIATLFLIGLSIMSGAQALRRLPNHDLSAIAFIATMYIVMHFTYTYVDIAWDIQSMVLMGAMMGIVNSIEHVVAKPVQLPTRRWPWQADRRPPARVQSYWKTRTALNKIRKVLQEETRTVPPEIMVGPHPADPIATLCHESLASPHLAGWRAADRKGTVVFNFPTMLGHRGMLKELHIGENRCHQRRLLFRPGSPDPHWG